MPTTFTKGDLFSNPDLGAFAHGCNLAGAMDAGVAVAFKKRYPRMFEEYKQRCADGRLSLGEVFLWQEGEQAVFNLAIQQHWKTRPKLAALLKALEKTLELAGNAGITRIGLPRLGAGVGGLDWTRVRKVLTELGEQTEIELVVYEQFVRAKPEADSE